MCLILIICEFFPHLAEYPAEFVRIIHSPRAVSEAGKAERIRPEGPIRVKRES